MKCDYCKKEMNTASTCSWNKTVEYPDGKKLNSSLYKDSVKCHDCGIKNGGKHHPGCDMERCPKCEGQLISCGCLDEEDK